MARKQPDGLTVKEVSQRAGVTPRAIRFWVRRGVLPAPKFRGPSTRYGLDFLTRIHALQALQRQGLDLREIRQRLLNAAQAELEQLAAVVTGVAQNAAQVAAGAGAPVAPASTHVVEKWGRVVLLPGLELHLREGMGPAMVRLANGIVAQFGGPGAGAPRA